jgi:lysozyme
MTRLWSRAAVGVALTVAIAQAGCGSRHVLARSAHSTSSASGAHSVRVAPPRFGDSNPVIWPGRTPTAYQVHGIDVSRYQSAIDWPAARASGVSFAFIKATEGADWADPGFARHWSEAAAAGVPRGAYHFYYFCRSAAEQAQWFIDNVPRERGALPPVLDLEWNAASQTCPFRPDAASVRAEVLTFLNTVGRHYDQQPIIYTTPDFWQDNELWRIQGAQPWLRAVTRHPSEAYPGEAWAFWQYSGTGLVPGVAGPVDLNAFAGPPNVWAGWLQENTH